MSKSYIHGVAAGGDLAGMSLGQAPEHRVGKGVFPHVGQDFLLNLEGRVVG